MKKIIVVLFFITAGCAGTDTITYDTSTEGLLEFIGEIQTDFLRHHLEIIAHDSLNGRDTGMRGQKIAADYLAGFYEELGFTPKGDNGSWFQHFDLNATTTDSLVYTTYHVDGSDSLLVNKTIEAPGLHGDYYRVFGGDIPLEGDVVFAGFGVNDYDRGVQHLDGDDLEDRWVLIFDEIPYVVDGDTLINPRISSNNRMSLILRNYNAKGILLMSDLSRENFDESAERHSRLVANPENLSLRYLQQGQRARGLPVAQMHISPKMAADILGLGSEAHLEAARESLIGNLQDFRASETSHYLRYAPYAGPGVLETENVLAYLEGADPEFREEALVLVAHYDHLGIGPPDESGDMIYNGADDNGSGTVALMAVANALNEARNAGYKPKRSVLFLHVSAEEVGLLGSRYYSDHPVIPIEKTIANFNADMVGRSDSRNVETGDTDYVYLIGGDIISSELDSLVVVANERSVNMRIDRHYNDLTDPNQLFRRSDHWNFGRLSIPFVFFFTGLHDDYHQPSDTVDNIEFDKYTRIVQLIYTSAIKVTNAENRPEVDNEEFIDITNRIPR
jgi:hypothetical protein